MSNCNEECFLKGVKKIYLGEIINGKVEKYFEVEFENSISTPIKKNELGTAFFQYPNYEETLK